MYLKVMTVVMQDSYSLQLERWKNMLDFIKFHCYITSYKFHRSVNLCPYHYQIILLYYSLLIKKKALEEYVYPCRDLSIK